MDPNTPRGAYLVYDAADGYLVLFAWPGVTWVLQSTWTNLSLAPASEPPQPFLSSEGGAAGYDSNDGYVVLFGDGNQTWRFAAGSWQNVTGQVGMAPPQESSLTMTWDARDGSLLLVGSGNGTPATANLTWEFRDGQWQNATNDSDAPPVVVQGYLFYDPFLEQTILFDGSIEPADHLGPPLTNNYTWGFAAGVWSNLTGSVGPVRPPSAIAGFTGSGGAGYETEGYYLFEAPGTGAQGWTLQPWAFGATAIPFLNLSKSLVEAGAPLNATAAILGTDGPYNFSYAGLPPGCPTPVATNFTCTPSSPPASPTGYSVVLSVISPDGYVAMSEALVEVVAGLSARATISGTLFDLGQSFQIDVAAVPGVLPIAYHYSGLPPGCGSVDESELTCAPTSTGSFRVVATASDGGGESRTFIWTVEIAPDLILTFGPPSSSAGEVGLPIEIPWEVSEGNPPYKVTFEDLPNGCEATNTTPITCVPTEPGDWMVVISATDSANVTETVSLSLEVWPALDLVSLSVAPSTSITLGGGMLLVANATGGAPPITYAFSGLPSGCASENRSTIDCTPSMVGSWTVQATVIDGLGAHRTTSVTLQVRAASTVVLSATEWVGVGILGVGAIVLAVLVARRRQRRRAHPQEALDDSDDRVR
jgi:hypothetical protein